jgi:hypothetical protein
MDNGKQTKGAKKPKSYKLLKLRFPNLHLQVFGDEPNYEWESRYLVQAFILSESTIRFHFGIQMVSGEKLNEKGELDVSEGRPPYDALVEAEAMGEFEYINHEIPTEVPSVKDLVMAPNMLAALFPYIRERIHNLLQANRIEYHYPSMNIVKFIHDTGSKYEVHDLRKSKQDS